MQLVKKALGVCLAGAALVAATAVTATAALADGMPSRARSFAPAPYSWAGFYAGLHVGYGTSDDPRIETSYLPSPTAFNGHPIQPTIHSSGFLGGGQLGYNWQFGTIVAGVETDISLASVEGTQSAPFLLFGGFVLTPNSRHTYRQELDWLGTTRVRLGLTVTPTMLAYVTGGLAYGRTTHSAFTDVLPGAPGFQFSGSDSDVKLGWTLGGGIENALTMLGRNWTLKAEALYYDLGDSTVTASRTVVGPPGFFVTHRFQDTGFVARAGLNYRF